MKNLYYRGYVIREDIRSICYTVFDVLPRRRELGNSSTVVEAMQLIDRKVVHQAASRWENCEPARA